MSAVSPEMGQRLAEYYKKNEDSKTYKLQVRSNDRQSLVQISSYAIEQANQQSSEKHPLMDKKQKYTHSLECTNLCKIISASVAMIFIGFLLSHLNSK